MAKLNLFPNETQKNQDVQNQQIFVGFQNIYTWSNEIAAQVPVDYVEGNNITNDSTTSISYVSLKNFTFVFDVKNPKAFLNIALSLKGTGYIGIFINDLLLREIPFNYTNFSPLAFSRVEGLKVGTNKLALYWRSSTGTIEKACSTATPGFNSVQVVSINS